MSLPELTSRLREAADAFGPGVGIVSILTEAASAIDALTLTAINQGWSGLDERCYTSSSAYAQARLAAVEHHAEMTLASGYDATGYLRDARSGALK